MQFRRPTDHSIAAFLEEQRGLEFSYAPVGASSGDGLPGYDLDQNRIELGRGAAAFEAARDALRGWRMFPPGWTELVHPDEAIRPGMVVAMLARAWGCWWLNACRVVHVIDEPRRYGFAYGTLPGHVESGEERFLVEWLPDDSVWYDIRAVSRPRFWLVRLAYPLARRLQRRFVRESQAALRAAVEAGCGRVP